MLVITKSNDLLMHKAFGDESDCVITSSFDAIVPLLSLDPRLSNPVRDAFILSSDDVKSRKDMTRFKEALASKHPAVKILYISKKSKDVLTADTPGIDGYLTNPKAPEVKEMIAKIIESDAISDAAKIQEREYQNAYANNGQDGINLNGFQQQDIDVPIPDKNTYENQSQDFVPIPESSNEDAFANAGMPVYEEEQQPEIVVPNLESPIETPVDFGNLPIEAPPDMTENLLSKINSARKVADIDALMREITATEIVKDLIQNNSIYSAIEDKLQAINNAIYEIMRDDRKYPKLTEKLNAVRGLLHDRAFMSSKADTLIEQRVEEVIDCICSKTSEILQDKLQELDTSIRRIDKSRMIDTGDQRLAGLGEERVNLILELAKLQEDINNIYMNSDTLCMSTITKIGERSVDLTGSEILNTRIKAMGDTCVGDETLIAIRSLSDVASSTLPKEFKDMLRSIVVMTKTLNDVLDLDKEYIAAQQASIDYLKSKNIEASVLTERLLKKSMRVFIAQENSGRTIIPYLMSYYQSRQNYNVLLFDITGTGKYDMYDIRYRTPEAFMTNLNQQHFCLVSGEVPNTVATGQRIVTALNKAADYYRVINVVMRPDQKELFDVIAEDVLCVNYIVNPYPSNIEAMAGVIKNTQRENVGMRVIYNKCDVPIRYIIKMLGLEEVMDVQFCIIPTINEITDAAIRKYNPYSITSVSIALEDALKYVKS